MVHGLGTRHWHITRHQDGNINNTKQNITNNKSSKSNHNSNTKRSNNGSTARQNAHPTFAMPTADQKPHPTTTRLPLRHDLATFL